MLIIKNHKNFTFLQYFPKSVDEYECIFAMKPTICIVLMEIMRRVSWFRKEGQKKGGWENANRKPWETNGRRLPFLLSAMVLRGNDNVIPLILHFRIFIIDKGGYSIV